MTDRAHLLARLAFLGPALTDAALVTLVELANRLPRRALDGLALARYQAEREAGIVPPPVDPEARSLGAVLAAVAAEVERATLKHGRTFPGGWGPAGRLVDREAMLRAQDACEAPPGDGGGSFRRVLEEELAEVWAESAASADAARELVQVAAVAVRGVLVVAANGGERA